MNNMNNNAGYVQAVVADLLAQQHHNQEQQALMQRINQYLVNITQDQQELADCLLRCGVDTSKMMYAVLWEGFQSLSDLRNLMLKDLTEMSLRIARKPASEGPVTIGLVVLKCLEALIYWVKSRSAADLC